MTKTAKKQACFAHNHMTIQQYGLWTHLREISAKYKVVYFDGRAIAARFNGQGKDTVYKLADELLDAGWLKIKEPSKRLPSGLWSKRIMLVLSHKEWAAEHPHKCNTSLENQTGTSLEYETGTSLKLDPIQSGIPERTSLKLTNGPVCQDRHKQERSFKQEGLKQEERQTGEPGANFSGMLPSTGFDGRTELEAPAASCCGELTSQLNSVLNTRGLRYEEGYRRWVDNDGIAYTFDVRTGQVYDVRGDKHLPFNSPISASLFAIAGAR